MGKNHVTNVSRLDMAYMPDYCVGRPARANETGRSLQFLLTSELRRRGEFQGRRDPRFGGNFFGTTSAGGENTHGGNVFKLEP